MKGNQRCGTNPFRRFHPLYFPIIPRYTTTLQNAGKDGHSFSPIDASAASTSTSHQSPWPVAWYCCCSLLLNNLSGIQAKSTCISSSIHQPLLLKSWPQRMAWSPVRLWTKAVILQPTASLYSFWRALEQSLLPIQVV